MSAQTPRERAIELLRNDCSLATYLAALELVADDPATAQVIRTSMAAAVADVSFQWSVASRAGGTA